jgi:hypothetical protein
VVEMTGRWRTGFWGHCPSRAVDATGVTTGAKMGLTPISRSARGRPTPLRVDAGADRLGSGPPSTAPGGPLLGLSSCSLTHRLTSLRSSTACSRARAAATAASNGKRFHRSLEFTRAPAGGRLSSTRPGAGSATAIGTPPCGRYGQGRHFLNLRAKGCQPGLNVDVRARRAGHG